MQWKMWLKADSVVNRIFILMNIATMIRYKRVSEKNLLWVYKEKEVVDEISNRKGLGTSL